MYISNAKRQLKQIKNRRLYKELNMNQKAAIKIKEGISECLTLGGK